MENIWMFLQQTAAASLTALFLLILQRIFLDKLSPRWQYGVWFVLLLRLLVPAGFGSRSTVLDVTFWVETLRARVELGLNSAYSSPFVSALPAAPVPLPPEGAPASWTDVLFLVYLAGVLLSALWFVLCAARLSRRVGAGVPVEGDRRAQIEALAAEHRLPCPARIVECRGDHSPFVLGALRPTLVLPMGWAVDGKVVLHELLHLKYRDVWAGWLTTLFRCLHWCNPFLWFVFDKIGSDRESLCDQRVLERLSGEDRRDYGRVLLAMADDRAVRTPGATTMANGARAVKARIEAIARFKRFPQGMGLVSGCIVFALSLSLVAGTPVSALAAGEPVDLPHGANTAQVLSAAAQNRVSTVAGALDAYGKSVYLRYNLPPESLLCTAMVTPVEDMPAVLADWEAFVDTMDMKEALYWYSTGPIFRGLTSDGAGGYLCQAFWFRDVELESQSDPLWPEEGEPWPVEYLCHTVRVRPDGDFWVVEKLAETTGIFDADVSIAGLGRWSGSMLYGPVTWSGEADGLKIELSPAQTMTTGDGVLGEDLLQRFQESEGYKNPLSFWESSEEEGSSLRDPMPRLEGFTGFFSGLLVSRENTWDRQRTFTVEITPRWDDPWIVTPEQERQLRYVDLQGDTEELEKYLLNRAVHSVEYEYEPMSAGKKAVFPEGGGGGWGSRGAWDGPMEQYIAPDYFTVTVTNADGEVFPVDLTPRYTTPDGKTFTLDGEEGPQ